jgi:aminoglycoside 3-N-acetyltransferase
MSRSPVARLKHFVKHRVLPWVRRRRYDPIAMKLQRDVLTRDRLVGELRALGVGPGDTLLVHTSMRKLGPLADGPDTAIDALWEAIQPGGTLVMPTFTVSGLMYDYVRSNPSFDTDTTPSHVGKITEMFRLRPGVLRSTHPTHSMAALGPNARRIATGHETCPTSFGPGSPFCHLIDLRGKILCLGVSIAYYTSYHAFEDLNPDYPEPVYVEGDFELDATGPDGTVHRVKVRPHNPATTARRIEKHPDKLAEIEGLLRDMGVMKEGPVGQTTGYLVGARELNDALGVLLRERGVTIYVAPDRVKPAGA